jgi:hypothetical protein
MPEATAHTTICRQEAERLRTGGRGKAPAVVTSWLADAFIGYQWYRIGTL